jgi:hypothetical protein
MMMKYRFSRARRMVEFTFGIVANKRRIFHGTSDVKPDFNDSIIQDGCVLHNYVQKNYGIRFEDALYDCRLESVQPVGTRGSVRNIAVRNYFAKYFTSPQGSIPWQYSKYNTYSLSVGAIIYVNKLLPSLQIFFYVINNAPQFPFERFIRGLTRV